MKDHAVAFLQENAIGRTLLTDPVRYVLEGGSLTGEYSDTMQFSGLTESDTTIQFDMTTVTRETVRTAGGEHLKDYTGTSVFRYTLARRRSTGALTGFMQCISTTVREQTMDAVVYGISNVEMVGGELRWCERQLMYRDLPAGGERYIPVAFDSEIRFYTENGKSVFEYTPTLWNVDPATMHRTLSPDQYPPFISRER